VSFTEPINWVKHYTKMFADHTLVIIQDEGQVLCWQLASPAWSHNIEISVSPIGVHLMGDSIGHPYGLQVKQDLAWWVSEADPTYLAEEMLTKGWNPEIAQRKAEEILQQCVDWEADTPNAKVTLTKMWEACINSGEGCYSKSLLDWEQAFGSAIATSVDCDILEREQCYPDDVYDPADVAMLSAIHDRFRTCFMEQYRLVDGRPQKKD